MMNTSRTVRRLSHLPGVLTLKVTALVMAIKRQVEVGVYLSDPHDLLAFQVANSKLGVLEIECDDIAWALFQDVGDLEAIHEVLAYIARIEERTAIAIFTPEGKVVVASDWPPYLYERRYTGWKLGQLSDPDILVELLKSLQRSHMALILDIGRKTFYTIWSVSKYSIFHILGLEYLPLLETDKSFVVDYLLAIYEKSPEAYKILKAYAHFNLPDQDSIKGVLDVFTDDK